MSIRRNTLHLLRLLRIITRLLLIIIIILRHVRIRIRIPILIDITDRYLKVLSMFQGFTFQLGGFVPLALPCLVHMQCS